jgi:O-antigen/teichoic acid export membrane protein
MQGSNLIKKTGLYFIGNLSSKLLSVLLVPIYAFYITSFDLGYYDYTQTIMGVLIPVVFIAIWEAILKYILVEKDNEKKKVIIATTIGFTMFMAVIFFMGIILYGKLMSLEMGNIILIGLMFISNAFVQIWQYYSRALEENKTYVYASITGTFVHFIFTLLFICILKLGLIGLYISFIIGQLGIILFIERRLRLLDYFKFKLFNLPLLKNMILFSAPLVLNLTSLWLMSGFGRFIITNKLGAEANGLFSFSSKFYLLFSMLGSVVTMSIIEEAILNAKSNKLDSSFGKLMDTLFKLFQSAILLAVPLIVLFYATIRNTDYYDSMQYAPWLLLFSVISMMSSNVGSLFQALEKTKYQFSTTVIGGLVTIFISYVFISSIGIYAVIIGQILGAIIMLIARYILVRRYIPFEINWKPVLGMTCLFIVTTYLSLKVNIYFNIILLVLISIFVYYINRKFINDGLNQVKRLIKKD